MSTEDIIINSVARISILEIEIDNKKSDMVALSGLLDTTKNLLYSEYSSLEDEDEKVQINLNSLQEVGLQLNYMTIRDQQIQISHRIYDLHADCNRFRRELIRIGIDLQVLMTEKEGLSADLREQPPIEENLNDRQ